MPVLFIFVMFAMGLHGFDAHPYWVLGTDIPTLSSIEECSPSEADAILKYFRLVGLMKSQVDI